MPLGVRCPLRDTGIRVNCWCDPVGPLLYLMTYVNLCNTAVVVWSFIDSGLTRLDEWHVVHNFRWYWSMMKLVVTGSDRARTVVSLCWWEGVFYSVATPSFGGLWKKAMCTSLSLYLAAAVLVLGLGLTLTASVLDLGSGHMWVRDLVMYLWGDIVLVVVWVCITTCVRGVLIASTRLLHVPRVTVWCKLFQPLPRVIRCIHQ